MKSLSLAVVLLVGLVHGGPVGLDSNATTKAETTSRSATQSPRAFVGTAAASDSNGQTSKDDETESKQLSGGRDQSASFAFRGMNQPFLGGLQGGGFQNSMASSAFGDFNKGMFSGASFPQVFGGAQGFSQQQQQQQQQQAMPFLQQAATASPFAASGAQNFQQGSFFRQQSAPTSASFNTQAASLFGVPQQFSQQQQQQPLSQQFMFQRQQDASKADISAGQQADVSQQLQQQQQLPFNFFGFTQQFPIKRDVGSSAPNASTNSTKTSGSESQPSGPFFGANAGSNPAIRPTGPMMPPMVNQFPQTGMFPWQFGQDFGAFRNMMFLPLFVNPAALFQQPPQFDFRPTPGPFELFQGGQQRPNPGQQPGLPMGPPRQESLRNFDATTVKN